MYLVSCLHMIFSACLEEEKKSDSKGKSEMPMCAQFFLF
jgi:hypothetical protein